MANEYISPTEILAYAAGIIDSDGSISIVKFKSSDFRKGYGYSLYVRVKNTDITIMEWLKKHFKGSFCQSNKQTKKWKVAYAWSITSQKALTFLKNILPYLIIKKERAEIAIKFQSSKESGRNWLFNPKTKDELMGENNYYQEIRILNRRGSNG